MHHGIGGMTCPTCGCGVGHGHRMGGVMKAMFKMVPWKVMMHAEELGISQDKIEALRKKHTEAIKKIIQISSQIKMDMIDLKDAVMRDEIDVQTATAKAQEIGKLKGDRLVAMIQAMNDMRQTLTPEERKRVRQMIMSWFKKGPMGGMGAEEGEEEEEESSEE